MKIYQHTKIEVPSSRCSKVIAQRDYLTLTLTFDLDPMTLIPKHDLDIMKIYLHTRNEVPSSRCSKVISQRDYLTLTFDLDLERMTLIFEHDLDIMKIELHTKNESHSSSCSKVIAQRDYLTLTLTPWPWYSNLALILRRYIKRPKMKFLAQGVQML